MTTVLEANLVYSIVGAFQEVYTYYGYGLSESVYAGALEIELQDRGHNVARELGVDVGYKGRHVYLRATRFQVGLLLHFGPKPEWKRFVDTRKRMFAAPNI